MNTRTGILVGAGIIIVAFLILEYLLEVDPNQRSYQFMPDMVDSPAPKSQTENALLPAGRTQQGIVEGVVVRGGEHHPYGLGEADAQRAARELKSPFEGDHQPDAERGADRYLLFCSSCHGNNGVDPGPVVQRGMVAPPSLLGTRARTLSDGGLYHIITVGQGNMAAHGAQIPPADRWQIVAHLRTLQAGK